MPVVKRAASPDLVSKPSPFHSGVTIFEAPGPSTPRRSKRLRTSHDEQEDSLTSHVTTTRKATVKVVKKEDDDVKTESEEVTLVKKKRKESASPRKAKTIPQSLAVPHPAPSKWKEQYDAIHKMREGIIAPVDTMGCDQAQMKEVDPRVRFAFAIIPVYELNHCFSRLADSPHSCLSCYRHKLRMKSRMQQ